jgi:hypothetical protein
MLAIRLLAGSGVEYVHEHKRFDEEAATWDDDPGSVTASALSKRT